MWLGVPLLPAPGYGGRGRGQEEEVPGEGQGTEVGSDVSGTRCSQ